MVITFNNGIEEEGYNIDYRLIFYVITTLKLEVSRYT